MRFFNQYLSVNLSAFTLAILTGLAVFSEGAIAQTASNSSETILREIVQRLLSPNSQLFLEALPPNLPGNIPIPERSQIIGSVISNFGQGNYYQIFLTVPESSDTLNRSYRAQLSTAGWQAEAVHSIRSPGFISSEPNRLGLGYCKDQSRLSVSITPTSPSSNRQSAVNIAISSEQLSASLSSFLCGVPSSPEVSDPAQSVPLPSLNPPENAEVSEIGGTGSGDSLVSRANIRGSSSASNQQALLRHYVSQLEQAGWTEQSTETVGNTLWSFLTIRDEQGKNWQGFLSFTAVNEGNQYRASIAVMQQ